MATTKRRGAQFHLEADISGVLRAKTRQKVRRIDAGWELAEDDLHGNGKELTTRWPELPAGSRGSAAASNGLDELVLTGNGFLFTLDS